MRPVEILVHVSAPSRGRDDARYRREARGFLDFQPVESHVLLRPAQYGNGHVDIRVSSIREAHSPHVVRADNEGDDGIICGLGRHERHTTNNVGPTILMTQEPSRMETNESDTTGAEHHAEDNLSSVSHVSGASKHENDVEKMHIVHKSLYSAGDDAEKRLSRVQYGFRKELSIHLTPLQQPTAGLGAVQGYTQLPGRDRRGNSSKTLSTTWPNDTPTLQLTSVKETPRLLVERTPALPRPRTAPTAATPSERAQPLRRTQSDSWQTPPSTIPDSQPNVPTYNLPVITSSPCLKRPFQSSSPSPTRPSPSGAKKPRLQIPSSPPTESPARRSSSISKLPPSSPPTARPSPTHISSSLPSPTPPTNPLEIHPPRPKTSTARFSTHLTPSLKSHTALLASSYPKYIKTQTRSLHPLERGHWVVPFSGQDLTFQKDLWEFLRSYISDGRAGWGVWAVREGVDTHGVGGNGKATKEEACALTQEDEVLKVYCWGEVVAEVWLVMYMGGKRKIKGLGSRWIDAGDEAVVIMQ